MKNTIKKHSDFMMPDDAPKFVTDFFIARARPTKFDSGKIGIQATKKTFRHAVDRNRAKRLIRAWLNAARESVRADTDYVFIARSKILTATLPDGAAAMKTALKKLKT